MLIDSVYLSLANLFLSLHEIWFCDFHRHMRFINFMLIIKTIDGNFRLIDETLLNLRVKALKLTNDATS